MRTGIEASGLRRVRAVGIITAAVLAVVALGACSATPRTRDTQTLSMTTTRAPVEGRSTFYMPAEIPGHPVVMVPFSITSEHGWFDADDQFSDPSATRASSR
ncbi:MAG: hypothetical protein SFY69_01435 [Planctomycetota bacterium]|nr:hypothetical protein [Planctomycetota bacterium]